MNIFKAATLFLTAAVLILGLTVNIFKNKDEDGGERDEAMVEITETPRKDYTSFATGAPLFAEGELSLSAKSAILCTEQGMLLYEKNADIPLPMASITKVMTAVIALEKLNVKSISDGILKEEISVHASAVGTEGSSVYLRSGERVSYEMLLYSIMLRSANDAACALAYAVSGSEEEFVRAMNEKARELSMSSTAFKNPHGLSEDGHYTTARDYARLMSYALENKAFTEIIGTKSKVFRSESGDSTRVLTNHNRLLFTYKSMVGGKTGFTKQSGRTLVTAAEKDGTRLICVTINAPNDWNDHTSLFEKGFQAVKTVSFDKASMSFGVPIACGEKTEITVGIKESLSFTVKPETEIKAKLFCPKILFAPMEAGREIGRVEFYADGNKIHEEKLYSLESVDGNAKK